MKETVNNPTELKVPQQHMNLARFLATGIEGDICRKLYSILLFQGSVRKERQRQVDIFILQTFKD